MSEVQTGVVWRLRKLDRRVRGEYECGADFVLRQPTARGGHRELRCEAWGDAAKELLRHGDGAQVVLSGRQRGGEDLRTGYQRHWSIFTVTGVVAETTVDPVSERE